MESIPPSSSREAALEQVTEVASEVLRELATTDSLTGALNRRRFFELAAAEISRAERYDKPIAVATVDADHFKRLNDEHGHVVGDEALRTIARVAQRELRRVDVLCRYGGEEFMALFPETTATAAAVVAERLRGAIATEPVPLPEGGSLHVTVSIGVVAWRRGDPLDGVLRRADAAMYEAKAEGRNRLVIHDD
jgi:diguanylate cyclase (GGDEF)-like protein